MNKPIESSHFISRWLTKRWEERGRVLRFYDFTTERFANQSSRSLFTLSDSMGDPLEVFFNCFLESPMSNYIADLCAGRLRRPNWREERAIRLTLLLQRFRAAYDDVDPIVRAQFAKLAEQDEAAIDSLAVFVAQEFRVFTHWLPPGQFLYYPSAGIVPLPTVRGEGSLLPITPTSYAALVPKGTTDDEIDTLIRSEGCLTALSVGDKDSTKIVVPAELWLNVHPETIRQQIHSFRSLGPQLRMQVAEFGDTAFGASDRGSVRRSIGQVPNVNRRR